MTFSVRDAVDLAAILREAAVAELWPRFRRLDSGEVRAKSGPLDLVTAADEAAERRIAASLVAAWPGSVIVGEEAAAADKRLLDRLGEAKARIRGRSSGRHVQLCRRRAAVCRDGCGAGAGRGGDGRDPRPDRRQHRARCAGRGGLDRGIVRSPHRPVRCRTSAAGADDRHPIVAVPAGAAAGPCVRARCPGSQRAGIIVAPGTNIGWRLPAIAMRCCITGCFRGTTRLAGCCIRRRAGIRRDLTAARTRRWRLPAA